MGRGHTVPRSRGGEPRARRVFTPDGRRLVSGRRDGTVRGSDLSRLETNPPVP